MPLNSQQEEIINKIENHPNVTDEQLQIIGKIKRSGISYSRRKEARTGSFDRIASKKEEKMLDRLFIENQLPSVGSELKNPDKEDFSILRGISRFEDNKTMMKYLDENLPKDKKAILIKTRQGDVIPAYVKPSSGDKNVYRLNKEGLSVGDFAPITQIPTSFESILGTAIAVMPQGKAGKAALTPAKKVIAEGIASATGRAADELFDNQFYGQEDELNDILKEAGQSGLLGMASAKLGNIVENITNKIKTTRQSLKEYDEGLSEFGQAAKNIGAPSPTLGEELRTPFWKRTEKLIAQVTKKGQQFAQERQEAPAKAIQSEIQNLVDSGIINLNDDGLIDYKQLSNNLSDEALFKAQNAMQSGAVRELKNRLSASGEFKNVSTEQAGEQVVDFLYGKGGYNDVMGAAIDKQYEKAFGSFTEKNFKKTGANLKKVAKQISNNNWLPDEEGEKLFIKSIDDPAVLKSIGQLSKLADDLTEGKTQKKEIGTALMPKTQTIEIPGLKADEISKSLKELRTKLFDLSQPDQKTGKYDVNSRAAAILHNELTNALSVNPEWTKANSLYKKRLKTLEAFEVAEFSDKGVIGRGEKAFDKIKGRITKAHVRTLKSILPENEFNSFKYAYMNDLLSDPFSLTKNLSNLTESERALLPRGAINMMKIYGKKLERIGKGDIAKLFDHIETSTQRAKTLLADVPADQAKDVLARLDIPIEVYQASIMSDVFQKSTKLIDGKLIPDEKKFINSVRELKQSGKFENLNPFQKMLLNSAKIYESYVMGIGNNLSSSLEAMNIVAQTGDVTQPVKALQAQSDILRYNILGLMSRNADVFRKVKNSLTATKDQPPMTKLRGSISILVDTVELMQDIKPSKEEKQKLKELQMENL